MAKDIREITVDKVKFNRSYKIPNTNNVVYYFNMECKDKAGNTLEFQFSTNRETQTKFLEGNTYEVEVEEKTNRNGLYYFCNYSQAEKDKQKVKNSNRSAKSTGWVRPYSEVMSIIAQSSFHNAVFLINNINSDVEITQVETVASLSSVIMKHIVKATGLDTPECKANDKYSMSNANRKSIVMQKSFSIVCDCVNWDNFEPKTEGETDTDRIIRIADKIYEYINVLAKHEF